MDTSERQQAVRAAAERISELDEQVTKLDEEFRQALASVPNVPHESVPTGRSAEDNVEVRRWGSPRPMDFQPKAHWDLGPELGILDLERAAKVTGARFAVYWDLGAKLERALMNFMLDVHTREHGYTEVLPPFMVNSASLFGTGQLPKFAEDLFKIEGFDFWLAPTAEVPVTNLFRNETLDAERLPDQAVRVHAVLPQRSGLVRARRARHHPPAPVSEGGTGEVHAARTELRRTGKADRRRRGHPAAARSSVPYSGAFAPEIWAFRALKRTILRSGCPGLNDFKEISSCSNFEAFQARRASIRMKSGKGKAEFAHTLNGSGLAIGRTWVAVIENYQQADGSVVVPEALRPYLNAECITRRGDLR